MLSFAVVFLPGSMPWLSLILAVAGGYLLKLWFRICRARGESARFFQWKIVQLESGRTNLREDLFLEFREFRKSLDGRCQAATAARATEEWRALLGGRTRIALNRRLPQVFSVLWLVVIVLSVYNTVVAHLGPGT